VNLLFEASVCGGIPIIDMITNSYQGNKITSILGILNGTTNYILTLMEKENVSFKKALKQAKSLGYGTIMNEMGEYEALIIVGLSERLELSYILFDLPKCFAENKTHRRFR
jgi:hypothetical protein